MKYRPMRFDPDYRPFVAPQCIYIVPLAADPSRFQVLIPAKLKKHLLDLLIQDSLQIRQFQGCPQEAAANIKAQLGRSCTQGPSHYSTRTNQLIVAGTALVVLGIINWTFPDPLPLADEILMIGGGAGVGIAGYLTRRRNLPLLRDKTAKAVQGLDRLDCRDDPLLSRIHEAIKAKSAPDIGPSNRELVDVFELESRWLVEHLDLQRLLDAKIFTISELDCLLQALEGAFPLSRFLSVERKLRQDPTDGKARRARDKMAESYGLSGDAFTVYAEFYRLAREIISESGPRSQHREGEG
ncbi:MAG: hypothetical protein JSV89_15005 [Spirochaetaceae bacterium]|nr:MAG: hypothetical protein JSV89_15005 [Spirochaetaceae bacterium]